MSAPKKSRGFSEESVEFSRPRIAGQTGSVASVRATLGEGGRLVIPAEMRKAMGVKPGDTLVLKVSDGALNAVSQLVSIRRVQRRLAPYKESEESVVDEFLADRRNEQRLSDDRLDRLHAEGMAEKP